MKQRIYILAMLAMVLVGCKEEGAELRPGLYVDTDLIDAFAGKEIRVGGQASCYTGLQSLSLSCPAWQINEVADLSGQKPVVWNFDYTFVVPDNAVFPQELLVTATDVHGSEMKKAIVMRYVPATTAPYVEGLQKQVAVDFDEATGEGVFKLKTTLYGEDKLKEAVIEIPSENVKETFGLSKREEEFGWSYTFKSKGTYPMTLTVSDRSGNKTVSEHKLIVMKPEPIDEVSDYPYMWAFKSGEKEGDYIFGFYQYMSRKDDYQYEVNVYAESDETAFMFSPTRETNGARKFGESPFVEDRIISVQTEPDYVQGYKPGKGYWGLLIDVREKTIEKWSLNTGEADKSPLYYTADWNSWSFTEMSAGETAYQQVADITIMKGNQYFCFATATDWTHMWRAWKTDEGDFGGWWFAADGKGDGATLPTITEDVKAKISFDTAIEWCYIIVNNE